MKALIFIMSIASFILASCEKDKITGKDIIGNWLLESREVDTIYENGISYDTNIIEGNFLYIINNLDTLCVRKTDEVADLKFIMDYLPPNIIEYYNCPIGYLCLFNKQVQYKILTADNGEMVWQTNTKSATKKIVVTLNFRKQH